MTSTSPCAPGAKRSVSVAVRARRHGPTATDMFLDSQRGNPRAAPAPTTRGTCGRGGNVPQSHAETIRNVVEQGVLADQVGVDFFGIGEHYTEDFPTAPQRARPLPAERPEHQPRVGLATNTVADANRAFADAPLRHKMRIERPAPTWDVDVDATDGPGAVRRLR
jgi:hypothetical protein